MSSVANFSPVVRPTGGAASSMVQNVRTMSHRLDAQKTTKETLACGWKATVTLFDNALILKHRLTRSVKSLLLTALRMATPALRLLVAQKRLLRSHVKSAWMAYAAGSQRRDRNPGSVNCFRIAKSWAVHQQMCANSTIRAAFQMDLIALRNLSASLTKLNRLATKVELMGFAFTKKINVD